MILSEYSIKRGRPIIGYTTRKHLIIDLDDTTYDKASKLAKIIMKQYPEVGDCLLVISSKGQDKILTIHVPWDYPQIKRDRLNIHLVFNNLIGYNKVCKICESLSELDLLEPGYNKIRKWRGDQTLRVSDCYARKGYKPFPEPISRIINPWSNKRGEFIGKYLSFLRITKSLFFSNV